MPSGVHGLRLVRLNKEPWWNFTSGTAPPQVLQSGVRDAARGSVRAGKWNVTSTNVRKHLDQLLSNDPRHTEVQNVQSVKADHLLEKVRCARETSHASESGNKSREAVITFQRLAPLPLYVSLSEK